MNALGAITGLGISDMGRIYGPTELQFAAQAVERALADSGLQLGEIDGLLIQAGSKGFSGGGLGIQLQNQLGMRDLRLLNQMNVAGATAGAMVQYASLSIEAGMANHVLCVFAEAPLSQAKRAGAVYARTSRDANLGSYLSGAYGVLGPNTGYALAARRHMHLYGTTHDQLGEIAIAARKWAKLNPIAQMKDDLTIDDYHRSRWIVEPLHLLDCCIVSNGAIAVIVSSPEAARNLLQPPVYVSGMGQGHPGNLAREGWNAETQTGATLAKETAFAMAGIHNEDVDVCEFYDCYTYTTLVTLEDYGFCGKGEGGSFVEGGRIAPGGEFPVNTGGGQLSGYYMWGMTPLSEGIIQARGQGGERQVPKHDVVVVSGNGGTVNYHSCLVLTTAAP